MDFEEMKPFIAITGATASGKSDLAMELCLRLCGEIISCDSMQVYRGMDIGTAKPTADDRARVPHHLIDIVDPGDSFSAADYQSAANAAAEEILSRGHLPVFCGGTGMYLEAVITGNTFSEAGSDPALRAELLTRDPGALYAELCEIDPEAARGIHPNNIKRVVRALEIYHATGMTKTEWDARSRTQSPEYQGRVLFLDYADRQQLYDRINARVDRMIALGLEQEVASLRLPAGSTSAQAIGYKEMLEYFSGALQFDEAVKKIKTASRNYAKRQLTWFRRRPYCVPLVIEKGKTFKDIVNIALKLLTD